LDRAHLRHKAGAGIGFDISRVRLKCVWSKYSDEPSSR
jgi:hypothetical protein